MYPSKFLLIEWHRNIISLLCIGVILKLPMTDLLLPLLLNFAIILKIIHCMELNIGSTSTGGKYCFLVEY